MKTQKQINDNNYKLLKYRRKLSKYHHHYYIQDGIEAVRRYREHENAEAKIALYPLRKLPIIGMSANSDFATKNAALESGMDYFLGKPFNFTVLKPLINQICPAMEI
jgi:CheY-like chemotaxis protein